MLSISYEQAYENLNAKTVSSPKLINKISLTLLEILEETSDEIDFSLTNFHSERIPSISIQQYLNRIWKGFCCSQESILISLIYIDRLNQSDNKFVLNYHNIHKLLITSIVIAAKFYDDVSFSNKFYAKVGGITPNELNQLEIEMLYNSNFNLNVSAELFLAYRENLLQKNYID